MSGRIKQLDSKVVAMIAAGEVIQRPLNAIKELIENSLDAGASCLAIEVSTDFSHIRIRDNGRGIIPDDLPLLCRRYATSKISGFSDLDSLETFGFRGEALSSMCAISDLSVTSRHVDYNVGYQVNYHLDSKGAGVLASPPMACASNPGTQINLQRMFERSYDRMTGSSTSKSTRKNFPDEYRSIVKLVHKYVVHFDSVSFTLRKKGARTLDVAVSAVADRLQRLVSLFKLDAGQVLHVSSKPSSDTANDDNPPSDVTSLFSFKGLVICQSGKINQLPDVPGSGRQPSRSNSDGQHASTLVVFVNQRPVEIKSLNKALRDLVHFAYLDIRVCGKDIDVNVHPSKLEVKFLYENEMVRTIANTIQNLDTDRWLRTSSIMTPASQRCSGWTGGLKSNAGPEQPSDGDDTSRQHANYTGCPQRDESRQRTDSTQRKLSDIVRPLSDRGGLVGMIVSSGESFRPCQLKSVEKLRSEMDVNVQLTRIIRQLVFVGVIDETKVLVQVEGRLMVAEWITICVDFFHQQILENFGNMDSADMVNSDRSSPGICVKQLIENLLHDRYVRDNIGDILQQRTFRAFQSLNGDDEKEEKGDGDNIAKIVRFVIATLLSKAAILHDYFSIRLDDKEDITLYSLPYIVPNYLPQFVGIPYFLIRLALYVDWTDEYQCFKDICKEVSYFYTPKRVPGNIYVCNKLEDTKTVISNTLFPNVKRSFKPIRSLDRYFRTLVNVNDLYKVFERC